MRQTRIITLLVALLFAVVTHAQDVTYSGTVVDNAGEPIIGASVMEKGTSRGSVTDLDGKFSFKGNSGARLVISYIGYTTREVAGGQNIKVTLVEDQKSLSEVVVVGYGVQKKPVVTASIAQVDADDLAGTAPVRMDNALKGLASGVTVTSSSGQPGAASQIRIRGVGTINNSDPLYIVDGMPIEGGLDYLNPSDIQSISVLKDAASGAIYGTRAANGVILVTTKGGQKGRVRVNYNFSYGWQRPWKHRDVLNATEYAVMMNEGSVNSGGAPIYADPYSYGEGTDWQDEVFNNDAGVMNHEVNISGASDKINYYLSMGYYTQDGIIGGNYDRSNYRRLTLRSNTKYNLFDDTKERDWLNKLDITVNLSYAKVKSTSIDANSQWGSVLGSALYLSPILKPYATAEEEASQISLYGADHMLYGAGGMYTIPGASYNEMNNPLAMLSLPGDQNWSHKFVANFAADLALGYGFKYRVAYSADMSFWGADGYTPLYYLSGNNRSDHTDAHQTSDRGTVWQIENTLTWEHDFGLHHVNAVVGQSALKNTGRNLYGMIQNLTGLEYGKPNMNFASGQRENGEQATSGGPTNTHTLSSYFFRADYNYAERYMAEFTVRRDGSSRFGSNHRYATFPSFSLGWNITNEPFVRTNVGNWLSNAKLRFSWGKNGNDNIGDFAYAAYTASGYNGVFGAGENSYNGTIAGQLPNPDLKWEESEQTDIGLDLAFFRSALTFTVDWYRKKTNGMIYYKPIPNYVGAGAPLANIGDMTNEGWEFEASYKWNIADAKFHVKGNISYLKNTLDNLGNTSGFLNYDSMQGTGTITRAENGEPFPFFYGYKTAGIFQNIQEVQSYVNANGEMLQPNAQPGDVRFVDVNGDGTISADDRTKIGKGMPDWTYGFTINAEWKGFDFMALFQGTIGNDIYDATRRTDIKPANLPSYMLNRWTGEGTSNKYPRFVVGDGTNWQSSDLYITDGSYFRLKNIQLGYTIPEYLTRKFFVSKLRFFVAAENLFTITKYAGFDPEISSGGTSLGVDYGVYPQSRTFTVGVNLGF